MFPNMEPIIEVSNISKKYHLGSYQPYDTLRDTIAGIWHRQPEKKLEKDEFWALKNVSFKVNQGETIGIIGRNGAGKSTLLKILSRITTPTSGKAVLHGRVASLLEVGTGFNQELTGRENIFLNGSVLGMSRKEIKSKFDEIVSFAEVEKFIDTPVKYYSSGMYTRLAFAVAAHLDPEILIVDEVLSVGDARFQAKSLGKMESMTKSEGKTILFVSHNLGAIKQLCKRVFVLDNGSLIYDGEAEKAIRVYIKENSPHKNNYTLQGDLVDSFKIKSITVNGNKTNGSVCLPQDEINIDILINKKVPALIVTMALFTQEIRLLTICSDQFKGNISKDAVHAQFDIPPYLLRPGDYSIACGGYLTNSNEWCWGTNLMTFSIAEVWSDKNPKVNLGIINVASLR